MSTLATSITGSGSTAAIGSVFAGVTIDPISNRLVLANGNQLLYPSNRVRQQPLAGTTSVVVFGAVFQRTSTKGAFGFAIYTDGQVNSTSFKNGYVALLEYDGICRIYQVVNSRWHPISQAQFQTPYPLDVHEHNFSVAILCPTSNSLQIYVYGDTNVYAAAILSPPFVINGTIGFSAISGIDPVYITPASIVYQSGQPIAQSLPANIASQISQIESEFDASGVLKYQYHYAGVRSTLSAASGSDGFYLNSGQVTSRHVVNGSINGQHLNGGQTSDTTALMNGSGSLLYGRHDNSIQQRHTLLSACIGQQPYTGGGTLLFPTAVTLVRGNGAPSASGTTCVIAPLTDIVVFAQSGIFVPWTAGTTSVTGFPISISYTATGAAGVGFNATTQSQNYELIGLIPGTVAAGFTPRFTFLPTLAGLLDTIINSPANGQGLVWNGSAWINQNLGSFSSLSIAGTGAIAGGLLYLDNPTSNLLSFAGYGVANPAFTTRSAGTKVVYYPFVGSSDVDYATGIAANQLWNSVPANNSTFSFGFWGGTTQVASIDGTGNISNIGNLNTSGNASITGTLSVLNTTSVGAPSLAQYLNVYSTTSFGGFGGLQLTDAFSGSPASIILRSNAGVLNFYNVSNNSVATIDQSGNIVSTNNITASGTISTSGSITAGTMTVNGGSFNFSSLTSNFLLWNIQGTAVPSVSGRSVGTKAVWYPIQAGGLGDFATGVASLTLWNSVPSNSTGYKFAWYGGVAQVATLDGMGNLTANSFTGNGSGLTSLAWSSLPYTPVQTVSASTNIVTGGTATNPTIATSSSPVFSGTVVVSGAITGSQFNGSAAGLTAGTVANTALAVQVPITTCNATYTIPALGATGALTVVNGAPFSRFQMIQGGTNANPFVGIITLVAGNVLTVETYNVGAVATITVGVVISVGGGPLTLASDLDVNISSPTTGQSLVYVASASQWQNTTPTAVFYAASGTPHTVYGVVTAASASTAILFSTFNGPLFSNVNYVLSVNNITSNTYNPTTSARTVSGFTIATTSSSVYSFTATGI